MAADWGLYSALRGTDNWAQRRQDKAINLQLIEQQAIDEENKVKKSMAAEEAMNKYFDEITGLQSEFLAEDAERIKEVERNSRSKIIQGIANYNGDLSRYVASGGITDLHEYKNSIVQSKEVKNAQMNKINMGAILKDYQSGDRYMHNVDVSIPQFDEEGNPIVDESGKQKFINKNVTQEQALKLFKDKKIDTLPYQGSEKKVNLNAMSFKNAYKDPRMPHSKDNIVTASNVKFQAMESGASEAYATELARNYSQMVKAGGEAWRWGAMSEQEYMMNQAKLATSTAKKSSGGSGGQQVLNQLFPALQRLGTKGESNSMVMGNSDSKYFEENLGLRYDGSTNQIVPTKPIVGIDAHTGKEFDLGNALSVNFNGKYVGKPDEKGNPKRFIEATVYYDADNPGKKNPHAEGFLFQADELTDDNLRHNWEYKTPEEVGIKNENLSNVWKGTVLIPIEEILNTPTSRDELNAERNIRSNMQASAASADDADYMFNILQTAQQLANENGWSVGEAMMYLEQQ